MSEVAAWPAATTRPVVLLGDPVTHSLSPRLHNTVFRAMGLDLVYLALPTPAAAVPVVLEALGAVGAVGANVTVPHKLAAHEACDELADDAVAVGAVNTLWWRDGSLHGTNTDVTGLGRVLAATVPGLDGSTAVVLGSGGAARAAAVALARAGSTPVVVGRRAAETERVAATARRAGASDAVPVDLTSDRVAGVVRAARVVVNATPLGTAGERLPPAFHALGPDQVAHDLVYGHGTTPFVSDALGRGADAYDGTGMLVAQAADAFAVWTGHDAPVSSYEQALAGG